MVHFASLKVQVKALGKARADFRKLPCKTDLLSWTHRELHKKRMQMKLRERLQGIVPSDRLPKLRDGYHIIGDIAILALPEELGDYKKVIAQSLLTQDKSIRMVLNKTTKLESERRVAGFEILAGSGDTITEHREYGFSYRLDVTRVFFNSHLGYERMRVASQVEPREKVLVLFAGVGPFVVPTAARGARVTALEKSREACSWLTVNARLNQVSENIAIINADAFTIPQMRECRSRG